MINTNVNKGNDKYGFTFTNHFGKSEYRGSDNLAELKEEAKRLGLHTVVLYSYFGDFNNMNSDIYVYKPRYKFL